MKIGIFATTMALIATTATADSMFDFGAKGKMEYSVENEGFTMEAGPTVTFGKFDVESRLIGTVDTGAEFDFVGVELEGTYDLSDRLDLYGVISTDSSVDYEDLKFGVSFSF